jgi:endoglucanase
MPHWTRLLTLAAVALLVAFAAPSAAQELDPCDPLSPDYDPYYCGDLPREPVEPEPDPDFGRPPRGPRTPRVPSIPRRTEWGDVQAANPRIVNPLRGLSWFVDKGQYFGPWQRYRAARGEKKRLIGKIALNPQFRWFGPWDLKYGSMGNAVRQYLRRTHLDSPGAIPQIASFLHVGNACHSRYLAGGRKADRAYRRNIKSFAEGIGDYRVLVAFEPDSLSTVNCLARHRRGARLRMLAYGVRVLSQVKNATVYLDAGASDWEGARTVARKLRKIGVRRVRGFMLNATHMTTNAANLRYGSKVSRMTGGKHFIVNTSDNGNGPLYRWVNGKRTTIWCNPPNSALGTPATTNTGHPKADGFFWVNRPGTSHGSCNGGPTPVGTWWEKRALAMARRAKF